MKRTVIEVSRPGQDGLGAATDWATMRADVDLVMPIGNTAVYAANYSTLQDALDAAENAGQPKIVQTNGTVPDVDTMVVVPGNVTLKGVGGRGTTIQASDSFPGGPVVRLGRPDQPVQHGAVLEDLTVSGNFRPGTIGVFTDNAHEPSALRRCIVTECMDRQVYVDSAIDNPANYSNHMLLEDCEIFAPGSAQTGPTVDIRNAGNPVTLRRTTINTYAGSGTPDVALYMEDAPVIVDGCHLEIHNVGIEAHAGSGSKGRLTVISLTGHPSMGRMIELHGDIRGVVMNLQPLGASAGIWDMQANNEIGAQVVYDTDQHVIGSTGQKIIRTITNTDNWDGGRFLRQPEDVILADPTNGSIWYRLPNAAYNLGKEITVKRIGTGTYNLDVATTSSPGGQTIDGVAAKRLGWGPPNASITVISDGSHWWITHQVGTVTNTF